MMPTAALSKRPRDAAKMREYRRAYRDRNKEAISARRKLLYYVDVEKSRAYSRAKATTRRQEHGFRKDKYGISQEQWLEMAAGGCGICNTLENLVVDHCHSTGKVRGVLCSTCNMAIGLLYENVDFLCNAILWLKTEEPIR